MGASLSLANLCQSRLALPKVAYSGGTQRKRGGREGDGHPAHTYGRKLTHMLAYTSSVRFFCLLKNPAVRDKLPCGISTTMKDESAPSKANKHPITIAT